LLTMEAAAHTYRYLDVNEIAEVRKAKAAEAAKVAKK
jgi:Tfp pilus assembly protein PilO